MQSSHCQQKMITRGILVLSLRNLAASGANVSHYKYIHDTNDAMMTFQMRDMAEVFRYSALADLMALF